MGDGAGTDACEPPRRRRTDRTPRPGADQRSRGTTKARRSGPSSSRMSSREALEPVDLAQLLPRGAEEVGLGVEAALLGAGVAAAADEAAGRGGVPRKAVHA